MVAYSVIKTEPLTEAQKDRIIKNINSINTDYLRYWVLIASQN